MKIDYKTIGNRIRTAREAKGLSQKELGEKIELSTTAISLFESGERRIGLEILGKIAEELQVSFKELLEGYSSPPVHVSFRDPKNARIKDQKFLKALEEALQKARENE